MEYLKPSVNNVRAIIIHHLLVKIWMGYISDSSVMQDNYYYYYKNYQYY